MRRASQLLPTEQERRLAAAEALIRAICLEQNNIHVRALGVRSPIQNFGILLASLISTPAFAWGYEGHEAVAAIARGYLTPAVRAKVDAILASDPDTLTAPDMNSRATWADEWRNHGHRETAQWHFADVEIDSPDLKTACFGFPQASAPASAGPAHDCVADRVRAFSAELAAPGTAPAERLLALKYLLHLVGDMHQPLHASDNHDRGGNCVLISLGSARTVNLHSYWDTVVVDELGRDAGQLAAELRAQITPVELRQWQQGSPASWAMQSFQVARSVAYTIGSPAGCNRDAAPMPLPAGYDERARQAAAVQLKMAGVRLAMILNRDLADVAISPTTPAAQAPAAPASPERSAGGRSAISVRCSAQADTRALHGKDRQRFRRACMRKPN